MSFYVMGKKEEIAEIFYKIADILEMENANPVIVAKQNPLS